MAAAPAKKELCACGQAGLLLLLEVHHVNHILRLQKVVKEILESQVADWPFKVVVMMNNELKAFLVVWQSAKRLYSHTPKHTWVLLPKVLH